MYHVAMSHYIRLSLRPPRSPGVDTAIKEGLFHGSSPMRHEGRPCRSLQAAELLSESTRRQEAKAEFLRKTALADPEKMLFMDCSGGEAWGRLAPFPECADWTFDYARRRWMGQCLGSDAKSFEAPLFAFWLVQALWVAWPRMHEAPMDRPSYLANGQKQPARARADLGWDWQSADEPRLELFSLAHRLSLSPGDDVLRSRLALLAHPALVDSFASIPTDRFALIAGSDQALLSLLSAHELAATTPQASADGRRARL